MASGTDPFATSSIRTAVASAVSSASSGNVTIPPRQASWGTFLWDIMKLPTESQRKEPHIDIFPDVPEGDSKRGLSNYLDEFLSAIKVFGYLERHVFHELTRTMQTRKLIAGETILLEEEQGFCMCVDGLIQIFVKSRRHEDDSEAARIEEDDEDGDGQGSHTYQLLAEVKNGAPLSSLFSILSLFTEDVKLRHDDDEAENSAPPSAGGRGSRSGGSFATGIRPLTPASGLQSPEQPPVSPPRTKQQRSRAQTTRDAQPGEQNGFIPPLSLESEGDDAARKHTNFDKNSKRRRAESAHPNIVARAAVDTTIAIIPATAFKRLTRLYPKASSHIVQVILTRLQRVTLTTGHAYLGLTSEVLRTEKLMNRYTTYDLPSVLRGSALDRLKAKFSREKDRLKSADASKGVALHNPRPRTKRPSAAGFRKEAVDQAHVNAARHPSQSADMPTLKRVTSEDSERNGVNAGDLLTNAHPTPTDDSRSRQSYSQPFQTFPGVTDSSRERSSASFISPGPATFPHQRRESEDEDGYFRDSLADCMLKAIGLTDAKGALQKTESVEQSPKLFSFDSRRQKAVFNNAFGLIDALDTDADSESIASIAQSNASVIGSTSIQDELSNDVEIVFFPKGSVLVEQGERNPGLYYVIDGFLDVGVTYEEGPGDTPLDGQGRHRSNDPTTPGEHADSKNFATAANDSIPRAKGYPTRRTHSRRILYTTKPGGLAGYLGTISSSRSFVDVAARTDVYVGFLPRASIERIVEKYPIVLLTMAKRLTSLLPRLILNIDFALEWVQVDAGQAIYREGNESDAIYIVLNGRLRSLKTGSDGKMQVTGEYGQGDSVGELEVLTETTRPGTLHAIRDTELAKLPKSLFHSLALENPEITIKISKIIANRMRGLMENPAREAVKDNLGATTNGVMSSTVNLRTVSILPVTAGVPVVEFGSRLMNALTQIGTPNGVTSLNQAAILNHLGRHAFSRMGKLKLSQYLADLEQKFGLVLYVADTNVNSPWTQTCISQADCILLVGLAEGSPSIGEYERLLLTNKTTARKELVLLHAERYCPPGLTRQWLRNRLWINGSHHHIHMSSRYSAEPVYSQARRFGSAIKQRVQVLQAEIQKYTSRRVRPNALYSADTPFKGDFHRLARRLTGKSVGLVLGGGGARGLAHIGIIRAMEEAGIPIDIIGGTSIGAFVGGLYAWDADMVPLYGRAKKFAGRMGSMWRFALDLTYPSAAYTTGHEFNRGIFKVFGNAQMEDFWLEFYCNTTNISASRAEIHTGGYVWRYIRASMTLAGLVPPLCDDGNLLVDGGYVDNLTVAHMKRGLGADAVFAVDVGGIYDNTPQAFGDSLSGFWAAVNRWNPFSSFANPPTLSEIQARLAYVSSVDALERAKTTPGCRYMRPPVTDYGTLDFGKFDEIVRVGYEYGRGYLARLRREGSLPPGLGVGGVVGAGIVGAVGVGSEGGEGGEGIGGTNGAAVGGVVEEEKRRLRRTMASRRASI
ncbi:MAG: phosphatidylcholine and lysophosphatidylcholine phospholipase [Alyxoria varia]|nr:MAG: phosphatidylcholine and lysophosphatidylcholine phospholipase [Alyxoria varia]